MIESEDDVRAYVRQASAGRARWVEPALGSTPGLPDCWVPVSDRQVHLELKCGRLNNGMLRYTMRPEQRKQILQMVEDDVPVGLLVGVKGTKMVIFMHPEPRNIHGELSLRSEDAARHRLEFGIDESGGFWAGVNFIISDFEIRSNLVGQ